MKIVVGVAHHKKSYVLKNDFYIPIHVGSFKSKDNLGIQRDDEGTNISYKNSIYCEITALYWLIHNVEADYYGLCHYRRYFTFKRQPLSVRLLRKVKFYILKLGGSFLFFSKNYLLHGDCEVSNTNDLLVHANNFEKKLGLLLGTKSIDIISTYPLFFSHLNVKSYFSMVIGSFHLTLLENIFKEYFPEDLYILHDVLLNNKLSSANMTIYRKVLAHEYMQYLLKILEIHEKRCMTDWCDHPLTEGAYSRISGYLAEIVNNVFLLKAQDRGAKLIYVNKVFCSNL